MRRYSSSLSPCIIESDAEIVVSLINMSSHLDSLHGANLADISLIAAEMVKIFIWFHFNYIFHLALSDDALWHQRYVFKIYS
ncbi:hypothetical protein Q3G72_020741 [Acer saccharum]|nr:hypothetical protein Q3G72_020741 [Acer saccharum]